MAKKSTASKKATKKPVKKTAKKTTAKAAAKKTVKKAAAKTVKKTTKKAAKKVVKKAAVKKASAKKATKKVVKKKTAAKKTAKKAAAKKVVKKSVAKKPAKKTTKKAAKAVAPKKPAPKKAASKKAAPVAEKPVSEFVEMAYGMYDGIEVCEHPKPFPKKTPYSARDLKAIRKKLEFERNRLREILRGLDQQTMPTSDKNSNVVTPGYSTHLAENATDNIDTETALMLRRDEESALFQVESALERLDSGTIFGVCLACGDKIGISRLRAVPEAHLCMTCKQTYDKKKPGR